MKCNWVVLVDAQRHVQKLVRVWPVTFEGIDKAQVRQVQWVSVVSQSNCLFQILNCKLKKVEMVNLPYFFESFFHLFLLLLLRTPVVSERSVRVVGSEVLFACRFAVILFLLKFYCLAERLH